MDNARLSQTIRRWRVRGIAAATALVAATSLAWGADGGRLAFFGFGANNGYTQAAWKAAEEQAKKEGLSIRFFDGQFSGPTQYSQIQDALATGQYKALLIMPLDGASLTPLVKQAYEKKDLRGRKLMIAKRVIEQRRRRGKGLRTNGPKQQGSVSSDSLLRAYRQDTDKKRHLIRKAEATRGRLIFATEALRKLLRDENFVTLLRAENLDTLPRNLAARFEASVKA